CGFSATTAGRSVTGITCTCPGCGLSAGHVEDFTLVRQWVTGLFAVVLRLVTLEVGDLVVGAPGDPVKHHAVDLRNLAGDLREVPPPMRGISAPIAGTSARQVSDIIVGPAERLQLLEVRRTVPGVVSPVPHSHEREPDREVRLRGRGGVPKLRLERSHTRHQNSSPSAR